MCERVQQFTALEGELSHRPWWAGPRRPWIPEYQVLMGRPLAWMGVFLLLCVSLSGVSLPGEGLVRPCAQPWHLSRVPWLDETFHDGMMLSSPMEIDGMDTKKRVRAAGQPSNRCQLQPFTSECMWHWADRPCSSQRSALLQSCPGALQHASQLTLCSPSVCSVMGQ